LAAGRAYSDAAARRIRGVFGADTKALSWPAWKIVLALLVDAEICAESALVIWPSMPAPGPNVPGGLPSPAGPATFVTLQFCAIALVEIARIMTKAVPDKMMLPKFRARRNDGKDYSKSVSPQKSVQSKNLMITSRVASLLPKELRSFAVVLSSRMSSVRFAGSLAK
jgi:hypothetical protein